ncbi:MAG: hypothetical protein CM15mV3_3140 [Caudoviricetes sp.]|nr:MAG: hypothetical protein CM15mV3_3140 [Caudoviricetes sp.]
MSAPNFYIVADGNAYALDDDNVAFGAPVKLDGTVDWDCAYDFDPCDEDIEYVAHVCQLSCKHKHLLMNTIKRSLSNE